MANGDILALVFFVAVFGLGLTVVGESTDDEQVRKGVKSFSNIIEAGANALFKAVWGIMEYGVIGVFALMADIIAESGSEVFGEPSGCASIRWECRFGKQPPSSKSSASTGRIKRSGTGVTRSPPACATRRRLRRQRVGVDETAVQVGTEWYWLYAAIALDSKLLLGVRLSLRRGSSPAAAFLSELKERHDLSKTEFLVDGVGYLTAVAKCDLNGDFEYADCNTIEQWFQTLTMWVERFHNTWTGQPALRAGWPASSTTITFNDRIRHSTTACQSRR